MTPGTLMRLLQSNEGDPIVQAGAILRACGPIEPKRLEATVATLANTGVLDAVTVRRLCRALASLQADDDTLEQLAVDSDPALDGLREEVEQLQVSEAVFAAENREIDGLLQRVESLESEINEINAESEALAEERAAIAAASNELARIMTEA